MSDNTQHTRRRYSAETCPETRSKLDVINEIALLDEREAVLSLPKGEEPAPEFNRMTTMLHQALGRPNPEPRELDIWSFDIDLTLEMPDDEPGCQGLISISRLHQLQGNGAIVGTCSDREPSDQRSAMQALGFTPDFCIPKELLSTLKQLLPGANIIHVGDDARRDRDIAAACQVEHRWPAEA